MIEAAIVGPRDRLQLVAHRGGASELAVHGLAIDLEDAFAENSPDFECVLDAGDVCADVVVFVAGATLPRDRLISRAELATANLPLFQQWAADLALHGTGHELVIVQSNPVELAVQVFAERLGRYRVLGAAALSDTMRLRREIAVEAGVPRQDVQAFVLGQHGMNLMPIWSLLDIRGWDQEQLDNLRAHISRDRNPLGLAAEIKDGLAQIMRLIEDGDGPACMVYLNGLPPDVRMAVKPFFVHYTGRATTMITARAIVEMLRAVSLGTPGIVPAQVMLDNEWEGFVFPVGIPVLLGIGRWGPVEASYLTGAELDQLRAIGHLIAAENSAAIDAVTVSSDGR